MAMERTLYSEAFLPPVRIFLHRQLHFPSREVKKLPIDCSAANPWLRPSTLVLWSVLQRLAADIITHFVDQHTEVQVSERP